MADLEPLLLLLAQLPDHPPGSASAIPVDPSRQIAPLKFDVAIDGLPSSSELPTGSRGSDNDRSILTLIVEADNDFNGDDDDDDGDDNDNNNGDSCTLITSRFTRTNVCLGPAEGSTLELEPVVVDDMFFNATLTMAEDAASAASATKLNEFVVLG